MNGLNVQQIIQPAAKDPRQEKRLDPLTQKETFLKLLVAQIKNQNPLKPADGVEFLTQLAQFTTVEQSLAMRQELEAIHKLLDKQASGTSAPDASAATKGV